MEYSLALLQAINDWQIGGNLKQKERRGRVLKEQCQALNNGYRSSSLCCFRQISLEKYSLWELLAKDRLDESISSWTLDSAVAKEFKNGVPPPGWQGVIFAIYPPQDSVIINLYALYSSTDFLDAINKFKSKILRFNEGIGRYGNSQLEIVLELSSLDQTAVHALGGYSSSVEELGRKLLGRPPNGIELIELQILLEMFREKIGAAWIEDDAVRRVMVRLKPKIEELKKIKKEQDSVRAGPGAKPS